ncbi:hypothetical protein GCM10027440_12310 [Nocardiopsis coralliicola]
MLLQVPLTAIWNSSMMVRQRIIEGDVKEAVAGSRARAAEWRLISAPESSDGSGAGPSDRQPGGGGPRGWCDCRDGKGWWAPREDGRVPGDCGVRGAHVTGVNSGTAEPTTGGPVTDRRFANPG